MNAFEIIDNIDQFLSNLRRKQSEIAEDWKDDAGRQFCETIANDYCTSFAKAREFSVSASNIKLRVQAEQERSNSLDEIAGRRKESIDFAKDELHRRKNTLQNLLDETSRRLGDTSLRANETARQAWELERP